MGKSSSQVVGYRYYAKFAMFIGNRIEKLLAINFDNRKWVVKDKDDTSSYLEIIKPSLYGENEGGVAGIIDIEVGTPNQEPNETYQKHFPLVSGYPYQSYLLFRGLTTTNPLTGKQTTAPGFYLGNSGYMKEMLIWVKRTRARNDGRQQWYMERSDGAIVCEIGARIFASEYIFNPDNQLVNLTFKVDTIRDTRHTQYYTYSGYAQINDVLFSNGTTSYGTSNNEDAEITRSVQFKVSSSNLKDMFAEVVCTQLNYGASGTFNSIVSGAEIIKETRIDYGRMNDIDEPNLIVSTYQVLITDDNFSVHIESTSTGTHYKDRDAHMFGDAVMVSIKRIEGFDFNNNEVIGPDINPIHKIREILTDDTAMGKPESDVNDVNFTKAADRIWDEGLGISWAIDEKSCIEAIEELCYHIEAGIRVNRQTGLYEIVLFRDDWFEESEIHDIAENKIKELSLEVMNSDDIVNQLNVTYYDRERIKNSTFSVYENGSILTMGHANAESVEFPYFMNMRNAEIVANWKLKQFSTPAWSGSFTTGWREARKWNRYDLIRLPWSKNWNGTIIVRIMKINLGNGTDNTVTIDFEEVIPYSGEMNTSIVVDAPVDAGLQPPQPSVNAIFEAPYYLAVLRVGQTNTDLELSNNPDIGYVAAIAAKPQNNSLNALLFTDGGVGEFDQVSRLDYCDILQIDQPIIETITSFTVTGSLTQTANSSNLILLNSELMGFVSFNDATKVLTVKRGVLDTVPKKHSSGSLFVFDLPDVAFDSTQYAQGEVVEAQVLTTTPSGIQESSGNGQAIEIQARAIRPYPPANVKINGGYWPAEIETNLIITWSDRNRIQQTGGTPLSWFDGSVNIEPNTQTHLILSQLDENQIELATLNANVTGSTSYTFAISAMQPDARFARVILKTVRDGYESYEQFEHTVELAQFFSAPYNHTIEYRND